MSGLGIAGPGISKAEMSEKLLVVRRLISQLTIQQQWTVIYHLIHERLGDDPKHGAALADENGHTYLFLVPPQLMDHPNDDEAKSSAPTGRTVPADLFLEAISQTDDPADVARRLCDLEGVSR